MTSEKLIFIQYPNSVNKLTNWLNGINQILDQVNHFNSTTSYYFYIFETTSQTEELTLKSIETLLKFSYSSLIEYFSAKDSKVPNWDLNIGVDKFSKNWVIDRIKSEVIDDKLEIWVPNNIKFEQLLNYLNISENTNLKEQVKQYSLQDTTANAIDIHLNPEDGNISNFNYFGQYGALGGTFDHLHLGHKILLSISSISVSQELFCGVMAPSTLKSKSYSNLLESIEVRLDKVKKFLLFFNFGLKVKVEPIYDGFGPTITDPNFDIIILTEETSKGGELVNEKRLEKGWTPLKPLIVQLISESGGNNTEIDKTKEEEIKSKLSSTTIRKKLNELKEEGSNIN